jgi:DNA-binding NtrC family response regulator
MSQLGGSVGTGPGGTASTGRGAAHTERLVFAWDGGTTSIALAPGRAVVVGRSRRATVQIEHASISREHATFLLDDGMLTVTDQGSRNGTRVGSMVASRGEPVEVPPGGVITLGDVLVVYQGRARPEASAGVVPAAWQEIDRLLPLIARGNISVLVVGETGVGKEVTANALHRLSPRRDGPLVTIHCAALPESLLEAELFGYERGAFTGATSSKPGLLESANGGTAFLDEITEVPLSTQAKLLRVVETKSVTRLGSVRAQNVDVRFVAATNRDIETVVDAGTFRADLYYRLAGFTLHVPSLRSRIGEVARLAQVFAAETTGALGRKPVRLSKEALTILEQYRWPGNVRELRNAVESAVLLCESSVIKAEHLPPRVRLVERAGASRGRRTSLHEEVEELERTRILEALERAGGNQSRAARDLGISRRLLLERLDAYGTPRPRKSGSGLLGIKQ